MESYLDSSEQRMRKLIRPLMFCNLHDATHFLCINTFVVDGCGLQLVLYRLLPAQDSYDTENCYYYMFPFLCIDMYNRNTHKK